MAKFVRVGYGHDGRGVDKATGEGYVYLVNDNVRTKAVIQPVATHYISQKKFVTTGQVLHAYKSTSAKGKKAEEDSPKKVEQALTRADLGISPTEKFKGKEYMQELTRGGNVQAYKQANPSAEFYEKSEKAQETYDSYTKQFIDKGENK